MCNCKVFNHHFDFQHERRSIVTCSDRGSVTYKYNNESLDFISKYKVDGGLISDSSAKCDFLLLNCNRKYSFFIELKGSDISRAIEQIDRSIDVLKDNLSGYYIFGRIVLTRDNTTKLPDLKIKKLERKLSSFNGNLIKRTRLLEETY
ncbi:MAG: hypothetical protein H6Q25_193 [Bacteroidetes bacterium]|nr:hypothetical protein [Bacteroidota bacterium]